MDRLIKKWFIIPASLCILAIGFSSFVEDGEGDDGDDGGIEEADYDKKKWIKVVQTITCQDVTTNITGTRTSSGSFKISADLGAKLGGTYGAEVNLPGRTSSFTISNYTITFPVDSATGLPISQERVVCYLNGSEKCTPVEPCLTIAINQIMGAL